MCRMLIVEGKANPWIIFGVTDPAERTDAKLPLLLEKMDSLPWFSPQQEREREQRIFKEICALMQPAASMEALE